MRTKAKWETTSNMFGFTHVMIVNDKSYPMVENQTENWRKNQKRLLKDYFWFRCPKMSQEDLRETLGFLEDLENKFYLEVWVDQDKNTWDASLKLSDFNDATSVGWSLTHVWMKWNESNEADLKIERNQKPLKAKVMKDGSIKVKVRVKTLKNEA